LERVNIGQIKELSLTLFDELELSASPGIALFQLLDGITIFFLGGSRGGLMDPL
jgi:hypothetical protein